MIKYCLKRQTILQRKGDKDREKGIQCLKIFEQTKRACGLMDMTVDYGSDDYRFESYHAR